MDKSGEKIPLERVDAYRWRIPQRSEERHGQAGVVRSCHSASDGLGILAR